MPSFGPIVPILRIFYEAKAKSFYVGLLGFQIDFEHRFSDNFPLYMGVSLPGCALHLTEHYGDASPGAQIRIATDDIGSYLTGLRAKDYKFAKPGEPQRQPWGALEITITDPFGNRLTFTQAIAREQMAFEGISIPKE